MNPNADRQRILPRLLHPAVAICLVVSLLILAPISLALEKENRILLGFQEAQDSASIADGWEHITYPRTRENDMSLTTEEKRTVLHVQSLGSASALLKRTDADLQEFPILVWCWKISRVVGMAIEDQKDRNDSAARVRVIFGRERAEPRPLPPEIEEFFDSLGIKRTAVEPTGYKIDYIWANRLPADEILDYPGSRHHKVVVVESGKAKADRWIWERRNLVEDFELLFEAAPPGLSGIVILTDTDDTNEGVEAFYSSVVLMNE
jgi:hypothetical protein